MRDRSCARRTFLGVEAAESQDVTVDQTDQAVRIAQLERWWKGMKARGVGGHRSSSRVECGARDSGPLG
jgi:hypothetical protein